MTVLGEHDGKDTYPAEACIHQRRHGGIADPKIPNQFSGFLEADGLKALVHGSKIPKARTDQGLCRCLFVGGR
jgi:hypothetical protein